MLARRGCFPAGFGALPILVFERLPQVLFYHRGHRGPQRNTPRKCREAGKKPLVSQQRFLRSFRAVLCAPLRPLWKKESPFFTAEDTEDRRGIRQGCTAWRAKKKLLSK